MRIIGFPIRVVGLAVLVFAGVVWGATAAAQDAAAADSGSTETLARPQGPSTENRSPEAIAAAAFARSDWNTAAAQYRALAAEGFIDPALYYNLGTTYARAGDTGRAVWMLLKARRLAPRDASIRRNLRLAAPDLASQMAFFPLAPVEGLYQRLTINEWALMGGAATVAGAMALFAFWSLKPLDRRRTWARRLAVPGFALALLGHGMAAAKYYDEVLIVRAVVTDPEAQPRAAPSEEAEVYKFTLPPGTLIRVRNSGVEGWIKAVYGGENEVFLKSGQFERL